MRSDLNMDFERASLGEEYGMQGWGDPGTFPIDGFCRAKAALGLAFTQWGAYIGNFRMVTPYFGSTFSYRNEIIANELEKDAHDS